MAENLILHRGGYTASLDEIASVQLPLPTDTFRPIPHITLLNRVRKELTAVGLTVTAEQHGLARAGQRYFGLLKLTNGHNATDYQLVAGLRNSHDKAFAAGITVGASVFICDNLSFSGEIVIERKHTVFVERDLPGLVNRAVGQLAGLRDRQDERFRLYKQTELEDATVHHLAIQALDSRVVPVTALPRVLAEWRKPSHEEFLPRTAWSLFNAFTEVLKEASPFDLPTRTIKLHGLLDRAAGVV